MTLVSAAAGAAESRHVSIDPALVRGSADAPVTIVEFSDYQCPSCKRAQPVLEQVLQEFKGKVRLVHKDFPVPSHKGARPAAEAARCAAAQGLFAQALIAADGPLSAACPRGVRSGLR